jgi:hypothetical protein
MNAESDAAGGAFFHRPKVCPSPLKNRAQQLHRYDVATVAALTDRIAASVECGWAAT